MADEIGAAQPRCVLANARLVLADEVIRGSLVLAAGRIEALDAGSTVPRGAIDCEGDLIAPGLVELHTDNLDRHLHPRPGVEWAPAPAVLAHDAELASCGITTVFDALRVGSLAEAAASGYGRRYARQLARTIRALGQAGALKIRHRLHLRAELCSETFEEEIAEFTPEDRVGIVSLMDHTPGQRQFATLTTLRRFASERDGMTGAAFEAHVARLRAISARHLARHEALAVAAARRLGAVLASHDDATPEHVAASAAHGVAIAEFPTTEVAAAESRRRGIAVMMGAPNLIRGGSHSGNVAAGALARAGLLDILSSDYAPASLLQGALRLGAITGNLPRGLAAVTAAPARAVGLEDRGRLAPGLRADLVRFRLLKAELPLVREVRVEARRVA